MFRISLPWNPKQHKSRKQFKLPDGQPSADSEHHMGHVANRALKRISLRLKTLWADAELKTQSRLLRSTNRSRSN
ncbi:MAG: hypothetical protein ACKESB_02010 [Candidatus Hodgkinia cicadicola]